MKCESSLTLTGTPSACCSASTIATLRATPPVKVTSSSMPTRRSSPAERPAMDWCTPSRMSSIFLPRPSQAEHLGLGEHGAGGADLDRPSRRWSARGAELVERDVERAGGGAEEAAGARRALVVHAEVQDLAVGRDADGLGVLAAHVHHRAGAGEHVHGAAAVAADLGDLRVAEGDLVAAVAGADDVLDLLLLEVRAAQRRGERLLGGAGDVRAGRGERARHDPPPLVHDHRLGLGGADVHPRRV